MVIIVWVFGLRICCPVCWHWHTRFFVFFYYVGNMLGMLLGFVFCACLILVG